MPILFSNLITSFTVSRQLAFSLIHLFISRCLDDWGSDRWVPHLLHLIMAFHAFPSLEPQTYRHSYLPSTYYIWFSILSKYSGCSILGPKPFIHLQRLTPISFNLELGYLKHPSCAWLSLIHWVWSSTFLHLHKACKYQFSSIYT